MAMTPRWQPARTPGLLVFKHAPALLDGLGRVSVNHRIDVEGNALLGPFEEWPQIGEQMPVCTGVTDLDSLKSGIDLHRGNCTNRLAMEIGEVPAKHPLPLLMPISRRFSADCKELLDGSLQRSSGFLFFLACLALPLGCGWVFPRRDLAKFNGCHLPRLMGGDAAMRAKREALVLSSPATQAVLKDENLPAGRRAFAAKPLQLGVPQKIVS